MADPGGASVAATTISTTGRRNELLELAVDEGHDADIPSNAGYIDEKKNASNTPSSIAGSNAERDPEKASTQDEQSEATKGPDVSATPADPDIVDWDGPEDLANPMNWSTGKKATMIFLLSLLTLITPLASSMFAPAVPQVMKDFNSDSTTLAEFVVSVYLLGFAFGPLIISPLSELYGRYPLYTITNIGFCIFTIACAYAPNLGALIVFRFFAGTFGVTPVTIGGGTIADLIPQQKRGGVMAIWAMGPLLGPVVGPVAGGYLAAAQGWRWVFKLLAILSGASSIACAFLTKETYAPVLLKEKTLKLRKETGNQSLRSKLDNGLSPRDLFIRAIIRPTKMLLFSPIVALMSTFMAIVYGVLYLLFTTFTFVFTEKYGFSQDNVGLVYIGIGAGMLIGLLALGLTSDRLLRHLTTKHGGEMKPEYRLPPLIFAGLFTPIGLFLYGWTAQNNVQWAVPLLGTLFVGIGILAAFMCIQTYLIDAFTVHAASAIAANTVLRSIFGAFLPLAGLPMYDALGYGWGNSLLGFITLAMIPIPLLFYRYGERIRTSPRFQVKF